VPDRDVKMAERLIEEMAAPWKPERYRDDYRNELMAFIKKRATRGALESAPAEAPPPSRRGEVVDIATLLRKSLEGTRGTRPRAGARVSSRARAARPRARSA
jgi:DNA end-binding protein Ku